MSGSTRLPSKRNLVERVPVPGGWAVKKDFRDNREGCAAELSMVRRLERAGVAVAPILRAEEPVILYRYLEGSTLADLLDRAEGDESLAARLEEEAFPALCRWLEGFYRASGGMILGDAHLRNFIHLAGEKKVAGVDFECCRPGEPETDVARLAVYTLTYDPALTQVKRDLASRLLRDCCWTLGLRLPLLERELFSELFALCARRRLPQKTRREYEEAVRGLLVIVS